ncbi:MAG TPA: DUF488 domain-containing protein, partial [Isosphaeraceae bacterium]|nr:DUF488 domain-containing protein [Isosphaeraceae bacterium]
QYNRETLPKSLASFQIKYEHIGELGGLRGKSKGDTSEVNGFWKNQSFHNYADYALTETFRAGLERLIAVGRRERCAMMCSEAVWWRCHRRIVADHLIAQGETVFHLMSKDRIEVARLTEGARVLETGRVVYPAKTAGESGGGGGS